MSNTMDYQEQLRNRVIFLEKWVRYVQHIDLSAVMKNHSLNRIAIYGGGMVGRLLYEYLYSTDIEVVCLIDRNQNLDFPYGVRLLTPDDYCRSDIVVDVIVDTTFDYWEVYRSLKERVSCEILSIDMLIVDIDLLEAFILAEKHIESAGARMYMLDMSFPVIRIKKPSMIEQSHYIHNAEHRNYRDDQGVALPDLLFPYYNDLEECDSEYIKGVFTNNRIETISRKGLDIARDVASLYYNVVDGVRYTADSPQKYDNTIHFYGNCWSIGAYTDDNHTIESLLQQKLNGSPLANKTYRVLNHVIGYSCVLQYLRHITNENLESGDIVILITSDFHMRFFMKSGAVSVDNIVSAFDRPHSMGEVFFDRRHTNHRGYKLAADGIYSIISMPFEVTHDSGGFSYIKNRFLSRKSLTKTDTTDKKKQYDATLDDYIVYLRSERANCKGTVGAVVMNCNPFTLGHRHLIKQACSQCDFLYVFVVEEDKSFFSFADRLMLVKSGTEDIPRVKVLPGGRFIISTVTFPEYFTKDTKTSVQIDASKDISIFADSIAPALNITKRFLGEEPLDPVTNQYNMAMLEKFPPVGISVTIIPRLTSDDGKPISASAVRHLLKDQDFVAISALVPQTTLDYLEGKAVE